VSSRVRQIRSGDYENSEHVIHRLASAQHGVVTVAQLVAAGLSRGAIRWAVERDARLTALFSSAYRLGALLSLGDGSALSHGSAGGVWNIAGCEREHRTIHVLAPHGRSARLPDDFVVHTSRRSFRTEAVGPLRVTTLARTLVDLAETLEDEALEVALDSSQHRWPFLEEQLDRELATVTKKATPGAGRLAALLDLRGGVGTESPLETRVRRRVRESGLPPPKLQYRLKDADGQHVVRLDFAWPRHRVGLHCDGFAWHGRRRKFELDAAQRTRMAALDWTSIIVTDRWLKSAAWLTDLERTLRRRDPQLALL